MIAKPSIMSLAITMFFNDIKLSTATGFLVETKRGLALVTNRHNLTGRNNETESAISPTLGVPNKVVIRHNRVSNLGQWCEKTEDLYSEGAPLWMEHPIFGPKYDFVALLLTDTDGIASYPYEPNSSEPPIKCGPSDSISVIGFPFGLTGGGSLPIWATGFIASETGFEFEPFFYIDCRTRPGQSGSAVVCYRSGGMVAMDDNSSRASIGPVYRFLGIYSGRVNAASDLGIVWKSSVIADLTNSIS